MIDNQVLMLLVSVSADSFDDLILWALYLFDWYEIIICINLKDIDDRAIAQDDVQVVIKSSDVVKLFNLGLRFVKSFLPALADIVAI